MNVSTKGAICPKCGQIAFRLGDAVEGVAGQTGLVCRFCLQEALFGAEHPDHGLGEPPRFTTRRLPFEPTREELEQERRDNEDGAQGLSW